MFPHNVFSIDAATPGYHDYNLKYSQRTIEYFERLRHVDPAGYAAWYSQYMQGRMLQESSRTFSSDRASVHSGQSSSNQRHGISTWVTFYLMFSLETIKNWSTYQPLLFCAISLYFDLLLINISLAGLKRVLKISLEKRMK